MSLSKIFAQSELEAIRRDAASSEGKSAEQRVAMFVDLMDTVEAIQSNLPPEERERRKQISDQIDPRPDPWWRYIRQEALDEYQCQISSK